MFKRVKPAEKQPPPPPPPLPSWAQLLLNDSDSNVNKLIFFPGSAEFTDSETTFFTAQAVEVQSAAVARPSSTAEVAAVIKALRRHLPDSVPIAVRGAGHATFPGAAKAKAGVTIDTRGLRGIDILNGGERVRIAAGHTWDDVYAALEAHTPPLAVTGGRAGRVGVVGFLLGAGLSYFSTKYGFGADMVLAWEVVLASGEVVWARRDDSETADLWDVLRGGSTNFGVVTAVEMACFPHPDHFRCASILYLSPGRQATLQGLVDYGLRAPAEGEPVTHAIWTMTHLAGVPVKLINILVSTTAEKGVGELQGLVNARARIPLTGSLKEKTQGQFAKEMGDMSPQDGVSRAIHKSITFKLNGEFLNTVVDMWYKNVETLRHISGIMYTIVLYALPVGMLETSRDTTAASSSSKPVFNAQGLRPEDGPLAILEICLSWREAADDAFVVKTGTQFLGDVAQAATDRGLGHPYIFPNYAWPDEHVMQSYGLERLAVLKKVASKWDPDGFFQNRVVGGFKISK
jgi:hypothetical protein